MKTNKHPMLVATILALCAALTITSCQTNQEKPSDTGQAQSQQAVDTADTYLAAAERYLTDTIGSQYAEAQVTIPYYTIIDVDTTVADDIKVWGDFWVMNYNVAGDTLKTISGGNHPGLMHIKRNDDGRYQVTAFDVVIDGAGNEASARKIFGENYPQYQTVHADDKLDKQQRMQSIVNYARQHNIAITAYQDHSWPPVTLTTN